MILGSLSDLAPVAGGVCTAPCDERVAGEFEIGSRLGSNTRLASRDLLVEPGAPCFWQKELQVVQRLLVGQFCAAACLGSPAAAALPAKGSPAPLPPPIEIRTAGRAYPAAAKAETNHAGWTETTAYVTVPQEVKVRWHVDRGGTAELRVRDAWDPSAPWRTLGEWKQSGPERGEQSLTIDRPSLLWLRAKGPKWPRSGISRVRADFERRTIAVLRGTPGKVKRPVILAEGYDPFNEHDWNDPGWQEDPTFARLVQEGREKHDTDTWVLDWGDAGAPLEQQAADFADIARQVREWNDNRRQTVAIGISMGAVSVRYALASAAMEQRDLGVARYLSVNGPHRGAWVNPKLYSFLLKQAGVKKPKTQEKVKTQDAELVEASTSPIPSGNSTEAENLAELFGAKRALASPAAQQLIMGAPRHAEFYTRLRAMGNGGYDPSIPRIAFSNGALVKEGNELDELVMGKREVVHKVKVRPLFLPIWITMRKSRQEFRFGAYPGELLPDSMRMPVRTHARFLGLFRFDFRADWAKIPTFIPTHSALDFPEDLVGGPQRFRYQHWRTSPFASIYVNQGQNLPHDATHVHWVNPRSGKPAPDGIDAVVYEIVRAFPGAERPRVARQ